MAYNAIKAHEYYMKHRKTKGKKRKKTLAVQQTNVPKIALPKIKATGSKGVTGGAVTGITVSATTRGASDTPKRKKLSGGTKDTRKKKSYKKR